jgi:AcrR family transcriptional regulator
MRDVAVTAGCSTGMVNHYFENKDELLLAAAKAASDYLHQAFPATALPVSGPDSLRSDCSSAYRSTTTSSRAIV